MTAAHRPKLVALAGVPNVGKTTIFNYLTGANQKVGNYAGVTVDKVTGNVKGRDHKVKVVDLPGTYNLFPRSEDEQVVFRVLCGHQPDMDVDGILAVADSTNLERGLFLVSQLIDLGYPMALVLNMEDQSEKQGLKINRTMLERLLGIPVFLSSAEHGLGMADIKNALIEGRFQKGKRVVDAQMLCDSNLLIKVSGITKQFNPYRALQLLKFRNEERKLDNSLALRLNELAAEYNFDNAKAQRIETEKRYDHLHALLAKVLKTERKQTKDMSRKLDKIFLHRYWGLLLFLALLFLIFQAIFSWAQGPMDFIDSAFAKLSNRTSSQLPPGPLTDLLSEGIIPGLGGILIFVPQIALLFAFLSILEGSGYMARAVFITDKLMRPFGLNGRSIVPLISGFACAIPAILSARSISNQKDRLITIFVTPFMSCSARLPVYIVLIGLIFPNEKAGLFNGKGAALFFMYILGIIAALASAIVLKKLMAYTKSGHLVMELPRYQWPKLEVVMRTMYYKSKSFVLGAGKIILIISVILWVLASYGPTDRMQIAESAVAKREQNRSDPLFTPEELKYSSRLEASYAGILGEWIEPAIKPLGYDWKIGIALICSFAAREVFVSTIATLYTIGAESEDITTLQDLMKDEKRSDGSSVFTIATIWSLLVFYAFAMQCMSTIVVVYRETKSLKWPLIQTVYMTVLAYLAAFLAYQMLS